MRESFSDSTHLSKKRKKKKKKGKRKRKPYKSTSRLSPKQKNKNPKTQIVFLDQNSGSLRLAILRCTSIYTQIGLACSNPSNRQKIKPLQQWNPLFVLCNSEDWKSLFVLCSNRRFRSYTVFALQQQTIQKVGIFPPFLVFYPVIVSRVLKITVECRFTDDSSQTEIDLVLKNIDLCVAKKIKFRHFIYVVLNFLLKYFPLFIFLFPMSLLYHCCWGFCSIYLGPFDVVFPVMNVLCILLCMFNFCFFLDSSVMFSCWGLSFVLIGFF